MHPLNKNQLYYPGFVNNGNGGGNGGDGIILPTDFGDWTDLPEKSTQIFSEQIAIQYKLDMANYPTKAILYLVGQFGLKNTFVGSQLLLGVLPEDTRPKNRINQNITVQGTECYLVIETNGNVKLSAVTGDLPVTTGETENFPYFINLDYNPDIARTFTANRSGNFTRNNCAAGYAGSSVSFSKNYTSSINQADADAKAANDPDFNTNGQAWANNPANGASCTLIPVYTAQRTANFNRNNCAAGYAGSSVSFSKNYTSSINQADVDAKAANDPNFNTDGQAWANDPANGATCTLIPIYTAKRTANFTRNNCASGYVGSSVSFSKNYTSSINQADVDAKAANDPNFNTDGQAWANDSANGATCTVAICEPPTNVTVEDLGAAERAKAKSFTLGVDTALTGSALYNAKIQLYLYFAEGKVFLSGYSGGYNTNEPNPNSDAEFYINGNLPADLVANAPASAITVELERFTVGSDEVIGKFTLYPDGSYRILFSNSRRSASGVIYTGGYTHTIQSTIDYGAGKVYLYDKNIGTQLMQLYRVSYIGTGLHIASIAGDTLFNFDTKETYSSPVELMIQPDTNVIGSVAKICSIPPDYSDLSTPVSFNP